MEYPESKTIQFNSLTQANYLFREGDPSRPLFIINHGFMSTNTRMWDRFASRIPQEYSILAPNGPFPVPLKEEKGWKVGYSWFFYDNITKEFLVDYSICKDYLANLVDALNLSSQPKTIIGFSQGGYASVHMAEKTKNVNHVIGMGCQFKINNPQWPKNLRVDAVHGEADDVVSPKLAEKFFSQLPSINKGKFKTFPEVGHKPSTEMLDLVVEWALEHRG